MYVYVNFLFFKRVKITVLKLFSNVKSVSIADVQWISLDTPVLFITVAAFTCLLLLSLRFLLCKHVLSFTR